MDDICSVREECRCKNDLLKVRAPSGERYYNLIRVVFIKHCRNAVTEECQ